MLRLVPTGPAKARLAATRRGVITSTPLVVASVGRRCTARPLCWLRRRERRASRRGSFIRGRCAGARGSGASASSWHAAGAPAVQMLWGGPPPPPSPSLPRSVQPCHDFCAHAAEPVHQCSRVWARLHHTVPARLSPHRIPPLVRIFFTSACRCVPASTFCGAGDQRSTVAGLVLLTSRLGPATVRTVRKSGVKSCL